MTAYRIDKITRELITKAEFIEKYGPDEVVRKTLSNIIPDCEGYESPVTGDYIQGNRARREDLKRHNCVEYDPTMKGVREAEVAKNEAKLEKKIDDHVDYTIKQLPARKMELLEQEIRSGAEAQIVRQ